MLVRRKLIFSCYIFMLLGFFLSTGVALYYQRSLSNDNERDVDTILAAKVYDSIRSALAQPVIATATLAHDKFLINYLKNVEGTDDVSKDVKIIKPFLKRLKHDLDYDNVNLASDKSLRYYNIFGFCKYLNVTEHTTDSWFTSFKQSKSDFSFDIDADEVNHNDMTIFVNSKIKDEEGNFLGSISLSFGLYRLQRLIEELENLYDIQITIIDDNGKVLIDNQTHSLTGHRFIDYADPTVSKSGDYVFTKLNNSETLVTRYSKTLRMHIAVKSINNTFANSSKQLLLVNIILFIMVALALGFAFYHLNLQHKDLIKASFIDELTKLNNRRSYEAHTFLLDEKPLNPQFAYVNADVNGLKYVNDNFGHSAGDELIKAAANCLNLVFSKRGTVYRMGGDEFSAIINTDDEELARLLKELKQMTLTFKGKFVNGLSISIGVATRKEFPESTFNDLVKISDKRMYQDKDNYYQSCGIERRKG